MHVEPRVRVWGLRFRWKRLNLPFAPFSGPRSTGCPGSLWSAAQTARAASVLGCCHHLSQSGSINRCRVFCQGPGIDRLWCPEWPALILGLSGAHDYSTHVRGTRDGGLVTRIRRCRRRVHSRARPVPGGGAGVHPDGFDLEGVLSSCRRMWAVARRPIRRAKIHVDQHGGRPSWTDRFPIA